MQWAKPALVWLVSRVGLLLVSASVLGINSVLERPGGAAGLHAYPAVDGLCRWDCGYIELLAKDGFTTAAMTNFFPLFPLLVRALSWVGVPVAWGLVVVPNVAAFFAYVGVHQAFRLTARALGQNETQADEVALGGLTLFAAFPFAFFHAAGYPESLMVCATAWALVWALEGRPWLAGLALGVGSWSRHLALLAGPSLAVALVQREGLKRALHPRLALSLALPLALFGVWMGWQWWAFGDPLAFVHARAAWAVDAWWGLKKLLTANDLAPQQIGYAVCSVAPTLAAFALLQRRTAALGVYAVVYLGLTWAIGLAGLGRYTASFWPAFLPMALWLTRWRWLQTPVLLAFAATQGLFFTLFVHQFPIL